MSDEFDPGQHLESETEADADSPLVPDRSRKFSRCFFENVLEIFNPFEALGEILEEPGLGLALLVIVAVVVVTALVVGGLCAAVQDAFFSGGPPQGLGLK
jgi:hypothetical protein